MIATENAIPHLEMGRSTAKGRTLKKPRDPKYEIAFSKFRYMQN
jgi:hypothetical protein